MPISAIRLDRERPVSGNTDIDQNGGAGRDPADLYGPGSSMEEVEEPAG